jgi:uncharacterized membrane protein
MGLESGVAMSVLDKGFITLLACSGLLIVVAIPLALRRVPRNVVYGFRTRATMANDGIWFEANAHFGRGLIVASLCGALVAGALNVFMPFPPDVFLPVSLLVLVAPTLIAALATARFVRSLG